MRVVQRQPPSKRSWEAATPNKLAAFLVISDRLFDKIQWIPPDVGAGVAEPELRLNHSTLDESLRQRL